MAIINLTKETFKQQISEADKPVIVDFWAPWCTYCRRIAPAFDKIASQQEDKLIFAKLDIDDAISVNKNLDQTFTIGIHITDLSESILDNSPLIKDAIARGTSIYLPTKTYNMLPDELSNDCLGLIKDKERMALSSFLKENSVTAIFHYIPLHSSIAGKKFSVFSGQDRYTTVESERILRLPMYYALSEQDIKDVVSVIRQFYMK